MTTMIKHSTYIKNIKQKYKKSIICKHDKEPDD